MNETLNGSSSFDLNQQEFTRVEQYRRLKETSVLVILFTDIKGFTKLTEEKGEQYSGMIRKYHDEILTGAIEENKIGLVVKHIGDSVMAVFSEPSSAVDAALKIQERIREFNDAHPEFENIQVRIGIHMGQVTVENEARLDLFGRHVNRASRVEGLADGGQIFMTYPVFDSAKGWLLAIKDSHLVWKLHGKYFLKGISEAVEIYEVADSRYGTPRAPVNAKKSSTLMPVWFAAGLVLLGVILTIGILQFKSTEVYLANWDFDKTIIDQKDTLILDGSGKVVNNLSIGKHLFSVDINNLVKNYMEVQIKGGKNYINPGFEADYLPGLSRDLDYSKDSKSIDASQDYTYVLYDRKNNRIDNKASIALSIKGFVVPKNNDLIIFTYAWKAVLNGKTISENDMQITNYRTNLEPRTETHTIYSDDYHYWYVKRFNAGDNTELELQAAFIEYTNK
ncbi:MAG: adenylate/guanylate cyclase domain-containing protein [Brevinematales bacterium]|jgi:class 3 adenylate cyclase